MVQKKTFYLHRCLSNIAMYLCGSSSYNMAVSPTSNSMAISLKRDALISWKLFYEHISQSGKIHHSRKKTKKLDNSSLTHKQ